MKKYILSMLLLGTASLSLANTFPFRMDVLENNRLNTPFDQFQNKGTVIDYCIPVVQDPEAITLVSLGTINNESSATTTSGYEDFTAFSTNLGTYRTYEIKLKGNTAGNYVASYTLYIDFDQDGIFGRVDNNDTEGENERIELGYIENSTGVDNKVLTASFTIPGNATLGKTRMRVMKRQTTFKPIVYAKNGCLLGNSYGQVEDYSVNIISPKGCNTSVNGVNTASPFIPKKTYLEQVVTDKAKTGAYSEIMVYEGNKYTFKNSIPSLFTTLTDDTGKTTLASNNLEITWTATYTGILRWYTHTNEDTCSSDTTLFTQKLSVETAVNPLLNPCGSGVPTSKLKLNVPINGSNKQEVAFDIVSFPGKKSIITGIKVNLIGDTSNLSFEEYDDASGIPGALLSKVTGKIVTKTEIGTVNSVKAFTYEFSFDKPVIIEGNKNLRKWLKVVTDATAIETNTNYVTSNEIAYKNTTNNKWELSADHEAVYELIATCTQDMCTQEVIAEDANDGQLPSKLEVFPTTFDGLKGAIDLLVNQDKILKVNGIDLEMITVHNVGKETDDQIIEFSLFTNDPDKDEPKEVILDKIANKVTERKLLNQYLMDGGDGTMLIFRKFLVKVQFDEPLTLDGTKSIKYWLKLNSSYYAVNGVANASAVVGSGYKIDLFGIAYVPYLNSEAVYKLHTDCSDLGVDDIQKVTKLSVYPNPFTNEITVVSLTNLTQIEVFNMAGLKVNSKTVNDKKVNINLGNLPAGVYLLRSLDENGKTNVQKLIKK